MTSRPQRAVRGVLASVSATMLAAVSHTVGGGGAPDALLVAAMAILLSPLAIALVGARRRPWRLALTVLVSQFTFHAVFAAVGGAATVNGASSARSLPGRHLHGADSLAAIDGAASVAEAHDGLTAALSMDPLMLAAHVAAAVLSFGLLYRGEVAVRALAGLVIEILALRLPAVPSPARPHELPPPSGEAPTLRTTLLAHSLQRRGPPLLSFAR